MLKRFYPSLTVIGAVWLVFVLNHGLCGGQLTAHGIVPRHLASLPGILWAPFLHVSYQHLAANTLPLLILGGVLCARSPREFIQVTVLGTILSGTLTWLLARNACHVGASGLIFCYFGFLASRAWFERTFGTLCLSLLCLVFYGGMVAGVLPRADGVSWESHAAGLVTGVALAKLLPRRPRNSWR
jgi:membrane associated rhomboid family serine protease